MTEAGGTMAERRFDDLAVALATAPSRLTGCITATGVCAETAVLPPPGD